MVNRNFNYLQRGDAVNEAREHSNLWREYGLGLLDNHVFIDGGWGSWSARTRCSVTCGSGRRSRRRACTRPRPANGGQYCVGNSQDEDTCDEDVCPRIPCDDRSRVLAVVRRCTPKLMADQIRNVKDWRAVCEDEHDVIQSGINCLQRSTQCTNSEAEALLSTGSHCFYTMMCDEGVLNQKIQTMLDDARFDQDVIDAIDFTRCLEPLNEPNLELRKLHNELVLSCMRRVIGIELTEPNNKLARLMAQLLIDCEAIMDDLPPRSDDYDFALLPRCSMRIWGEPHIETCNDVNKQTTCSAPGLQTYLDLPFLKITGVNTQRGRRITLLTEITIEFKSLVPPHPVTARYKAANRRLPETFEFLANQVSDIDTVRLTMQPVSYRVYGNRAMVPVMVWLHTGVEIIVSIYGVFYQFAMRASQEAMNTGTGILIEGCPESEELHRRRRSTAGIRKRDEDEASAEAACLAEGIPPNTGNMEACMFDVIAMNDTSFAEATSMSIQDRDMTVGNDANRSADAGVLSIPTGFEFDYCIVGTKVPRCRPCVPNEFLPDPTDCSRYYQCLGYGKALLRKCFPKILHFNLAARRCEWPWNVRCQVVSAGNGP